MSASIHEEGGSLKWCLFICVASCRLGINPYAGSTRYFACPLLRIKLRRARQKILTKRHQQPVGSFSRSKAWHTSGKPAFGHDSRYRIFLIKNLLEVLSSVRPACPSKPWRRLEACRRIRMEKLKDIAVPTVALCEGGGKQYLYAQTAWGDIRLFILFF